MTYKRGLLATITALVVVPLALAGCAQEGSTTTPAAGDGEKPTICLVVKSLANEYFQAMFKGATEYELQEGTFVLDEQGIQNETDVDGQIALVDSCITKGAAALVIAPADSKALVPAVVKASEAGLQIVNIDVPLDPDALKAAGLDVPFVGPDNTEGAQAVGEVLADSLGDGGKVVILEGNPGAANAAQRTEGYNAAIDAGGLELLDSKTAHWETDEANTVFAAMLTAHPDIQGVMAGNDSMALGVIKVIQSQGVDIKVVTIDNIPAIQPYVTDGIVLATLDQFGSSQANFGIAAALKLLNGDKVTGWQKTDFKVVSK